VTRRERRAAASTLDGRAGRGLPVARRSAGRSLLERGGSTRRRSRLTAAIGAVSIGAVSIGAVSIGAVSIGAVSIGMLVASGAAVEPAGAQVVAAAVPGPTLVWEHRLPGVTIRESSPVVAALGAPSVVVGAQDSKLYAYRLSDGSTVGGWPATTSNAINSSPSAADVIGAGSDQVFTGSGTAEGGQCSGGGVYSFDAVGRARWHTTGSDPDCTTGREAFQSSPVIGDINGDGVAKVTLGALGLNAWSFSAPSGTLTPGWPYYTNDTVFSTPALADVTGQGVPAVIMGGDSSPGPGPRDHRGGLVRAVSGDGHTLWEFLTNEIVRSSPAVGDITGNGHPSIVFGTGDYWVNQPGGASDATKVFALDTGGHQRWAKDLGAITMGSPALADVGGTGVADVVIGTAGGASPGRVWVLDGNGTPLPNWAGHDSGGGVVIGGITTADLTGTGAQDLLVPTGGGVFAYNGRTGARLFSLDEGQVGFQNSPLVTDDGAGSLGITVAGTTPSGTGVIQHYRMPASSGARLGAIGWPMFHHDARRTGNLVVPALTTSLCAGKGAAGYWFVARDGGIFSYCGARFHGSGVGAARAPVVAMASSPSGNGYWLAAADGHVLSFGDAAPLGGGVASPPSSPVVGMARTPSGRGYWLVGADGGIFSFGDARFLGSTGGRRLNAPIVGMAATPTGNGYWLVAADGGIFSFGDAGFSGSAGAIHLAQPIVSMTATPSGHGYWFVAADGGIFSFGDARFLGSTGGIRLNRPIVGMAATANAAFLGSTGSITLNQPITAMAVPMGS